ncbi:PAS domain S-box-containing protein [Actinacidiphila yanglinensis]|uniref:PAS domain S-box-containing protein n=1 Tax=Actinacidiphila yanglinensis TaxID=310779 RepID=A0A1H6AB96_9ACTN|nr:PAS domain-containing protein [Actinacidiphila yanglinensis]SEG45978.1 PAS domain S-box-containing protein [Actinacidiphila yanglinensis]
MSSRPSRGAARLASILDALPDALLLVNANGTVVNANAIALETFEAPGTALVGRGLLDLLPTFDPKRIPGSMRSPKEAAADDTRTKPTRMQARRTDGAEFPAQVTSANLDDSRTAYADFGDGTPHYTGDELLMLVVRDLSGTVDTEAELARQQRQTEMILRAAAEGVVGVDTAGKIVLVNPSAAQILGYRATDLGGKELHPLVHHSRHDGSPLPYEETPLADTLRSGRKHRVRGQVLWRKDGKAVPVDLTTAPVRDGDQLVGAVMTFTDRSQYDALAARTGQLRALLDTSLRAPLAELRTELDGLAGDPAGQLWPEANQILHHLAAGYARITTLIDNVLDFQRLDRGDDKLHRSLIGLDEVVAAAVEGAVELIGPGRAQFAVHAAPIEASVDGARMAHALAHLVADVAGVDAAGNTIAFSGDSTIVVAVAQRGDAVRIDVRGPSAGGDPVHVPLARGVIERHGGVLQTHEVPGQGSAYVLEVPLGLGPEGSRRVRAVDGDADADGGDDGAPAGQGGHAGPGAAARGGAHSGGNGDAAASGTDAGATGTPASGGRGGRRSHAARGGAAEPARGGPSAEGYPGADGRGPADDGQHQDDQGGSAEPGPSRQRRHIDDTGTVVAPWAIPPAADQSEAPTGRRRALRRPIGRPEPPQRQEQPPSQPRMEPHAQLPSPPQPSNVPGGAEHGAPAQGAPAQDVPPTGRRARRGRPAVEEQGPESGGELRQLPAPRIPNALPPANGAGNGGPAAANPQGGQDPAPGTGRRGRRALEAAPPPPVPGMPYREDPPDAGQPRAGAEGWPQPVPDPPHADPGARAESHGEPAPEPGAPAAPPQQPSPRSWPDPGRPMPSATDQPGPAATPWPAAGAQGAPHQEPQGPHHLPATRGGPHQDPAQQAHGRAISVRTLGQGMPFGADPREQTPTQAVQAQNPQGLPAQVAAGGSGRRRRLAAPPQQNPENPQGPQPLVPNQQPGPGGEHQARQHPQADPDSGQLPVRKPDPRGHRPSGGDRETALLRPVPPLEDPRQQPPGRSYAIGAPAAGAAEGPEPLDGPNGAVDVTDVTGPEGADDRHEEPLEEPRRLLVWPEPDVSTRQALTDRGYRPVIVRSREEVDAQVAEPPAALFVDPLTGPITRTALQALRQAAAAAEVPVLVTAGLGQATREAAYGADPAVLLKALAPRDSEQHPPRVLLVEGHDPIAMAFAATLERRGMQVTHADSEADAMTKAAQIHPNLVVMDLMLIRRRRQGIVDWLRGHSRLNSTPLVVYTSADIDPAELPRLASGETVLFLAERSTSTDVQSRIVDLLGKIGA